MPNKDLSEKIKVFIVDDSPLVCFKAAEALDQEKNIETLCCTDSTKAIDLARDFLPSVIVQDISMPGVNGLDVLKQYRKHQPLLNVPVIIHSSENASVIKSKAFALGASDYLVKSDDDFELIARVKYHARQFLKQKKISPSVSITTPRKHVIKVLMVDPTKMSCLMVKDLLSADKDVQFKYCAEPDQAFEQAKDFLPTVIIQSLVTNEPDGGFTLLRKFRSDQKTKEIPIILRSSFDDVKLKAKGFSLGANDYVVKKEEDEDLLFRVRHHSNAYINYLEGSVSSNVQSEAEDTIRVCMIDDVELVCLKVGEILKSEKNIFFTYCKDPEQAMATLLRFNPSVILLDLEMPKKDGLALIDDIRTTPLTSDVPVIMLSENSDALQKAKCFALGANDYIPKGIDKIELLSRIHYHSLAYQNSIKLKGSIQTLLETKKRLEIYGDFIRRTFGRYVSDDVVESILENPDGLKLGGEKREVSILMADLRNFTPLGETLPPEKVLKLLNNYFKVMTDIIMSYGATIDEFIGDAILAIFGAPVRYENHASRAVACAIEMQLGIEKVNALNQSQSLPPVEMGIGINTGEVVMGNLGCERRTKFGVIGRHVNLTSRIEAYTKGRQIFISEHTKNSIPDKLDIKAEMVKEPKGIKEPVRIYDILGIEGKYNVSL